MTVQDSESKKKMSRNFTEPRPERPDTKESMNNEGRICYSHNRLIETLFFSDDMKRNLFLFALPKVRAIYSVPNSILQREASSIDNVESLYHLVMD